MNFSQILILRKMKYFFKNLNLQAHVQFTKMNSMKSTRARKYIVIKLCIQHHSKLSLIIYMMSSWEMGEETEGSY